MRIALALLATLALPAVAHAATRFSEATVCKILEPCLPPPQYASGPFLAPAVVIDVTLQQIQSICSDDDVGRVGGGGDSVPSIMGCATFQGGKCIVHVPGDLKTVLPDVYDVVLRHELGHCRGWVHPSYASLP